MGDAATRLEEYRRQKREEEQKKERKEAFWDTVTLAPLRRRLAASDPEPLEDEGEEEDGANIEEEEEEDVKWTRLDWGILAIKILMFVSLQTLFIKLEFGAVFFMAAGVVFMWWSLEDRKRRADEKSAYSVFNPNCEAIHGSIKSEDIMPGVKTTK